MRKETRSRVAGRRFGGAAIVAVALLVAACTEAEMGAQADETGVPADPPRATRSAEPAVVRRAGAAPSLHPDPAVFRATGPVVWDGAPTLPGRWVSDPEVTIARRVRLTNDLTGAQADAVLLRGDAGGAGPPTVISSEAAERLGLHPGQETTITIEALMPGPVPATADAASPPQAPAAPDITPVEAAPVEAGAVAVAPLAEEAPSAPAPEAAATGTTAELNAPASDAPVAAAPVAQAAEVATGSAQGSPAPVPVSQPTPQQVSTPAPQPQPIPQPEPQPAVQSAAPAADTATAAAAGEITDGRRFIQVGVYGKPEYAAWLVAAARAADLPTAERPLSSGNRTLTRLLVGPFDTVAERNAALKTVRSLGAADAFPARE